MQTAAFKTHSLKTVNKTYTFLASPSGEMTFVATADTEGNKTTAIVDAKVARKQYLDLLKQGAVSDKKRFTHDCESCIYLGTCWSEGSWYDLYRCATAYVARFGNDGCEYSHVSLSIHPDIYPNHHKIAHALDTGVC
jgi:hypothetical protein